MDQRVTALVPMKGHSERVPNKNIRPFLGNPLCLRMLAQLEDCPLVESIIVNTDSEIITHLCMGFSKVVPLRRPERLCGDYVSMNEIIAYDMSCSDSEHFLQTHSTNPLLSKQTIERSIRYYFANISLYDSLFTVTPWQTRFYWEDCTPVNHNPDELLRTQDLPHLFEENSCLYIFSKQSFAAAGYKRIGRNPFMLSIGRIEAIDIDNEEDFVIAETLAKTLDRERCE